MWKEKAPATTIPSLMPTWRRCYPGSQAGVRSCRSSKVPELRVFDPSDRAQREQTLPLPTVDRTTPTGDWELDGTAIFPGEAAGHTPEPAQFVRRCPTVCPCVAHIYHYRSAVMCLAFVHPSFPARRPQEIGALSVPDHHSLQTPQHDTRNLHCRGRRTRLRHVSPKFSHHILHGFSKLYVAL